MRKKWILTCEDVNGRVIETARFRTKWGARSEARALASPLYSLVLHRDNNPLDREVLYPALLPLSVWRPEA